MSENTNLLYFIQRSTDFLKKKGIPHPRLEAEILLSHVLNIPRIQLYARFDMPLSEKEKESYRDLVKRRGDFTPTAYIIGSKNFYGYEFFVDENVLIPRPETEELVEKALKIIKEKMDHDSPLQILDLCSGSGCIGTTIALQLTDRNLFIDFLDISDKALAISEKNWNSLVLSNSGNKNTSGNNNTTTITNTNNNTSNNTKTADSNNNKTTTHSKNPPQARFLESDLFADLPLPPPSTTPDSFASSSAISASTESSPSQSNTLYHCILSNPPYVLPEEESGLSPEVRKEPRLALVVDDFLGFHRRLLADAKPRLHADGFLLLETNPDLMPQLIELSNSLGFHSSPVLDLSGKERFLLAIENPRSSVID